jgi:hypothetical protein
MKKLISSVGAILVFCSIFVLGWAVGQPDPTKLDLKIVITGERFLVCDFEIEQCGIFTVDQIQRLLIKSGNYHAL